MNMAALEGVFHQWLESINNAGLAMQHRHSFAELPNTMVMVTVFTTLKLDEDSRTRTNDRMSTSNRPLARMRYVIAISGATKAGLAEKALLSILMDVDRHPDMQVLSQPVAESWWLAHGRSPLPAMQLEVRITEAGRAINTPPIEQHAIDMHGTAPVHGRVGK